jgi:hypothetical protein
MVSPEASLIEWTTVVPRTSAVWTPVVAGPFMPQLQVLGQAAPS